MTRRHHNLGDHSKPRPNRGEWTMAEIQALLDADPTMLGSNPKDPIRMAGTMVMWGLDRVKNVWAMSKATGYDRAFVKDVRTNLVAGGVWSSDGKDKRTFLETELEEIDALALAALVGAGLVLRTNVEETT